MEKAKCSNCDHLLTYVRDEKDVFIDEYLKTDFVVWHCPFCNKEEKLGFPPISVEEDCEYE